MVFWFFVWCRSESEDGEWMIWLVSSFVFYIRELFGGVY